ncbi:MAG: hypothetical protein LBO72_10795 [Helicobacteraceae bacterium]|jgi:alpha-tubulin suppressor-like RCC1 family protein|nr:hypothetical protein [Helicobacteraceae bacterium]
MRRFIRVLPLAVLSATLIGASVYFATSAKASSENKPPIVAMGYDHSFVAGSDGKLYASGFNEYGQLGLGDKTDRNVFTPVAALEGKKIVEIATSITHSLALDANGKVYATGANGGGQLGLGDNDNRVAFTLVTSLEGKKIVAVAAGESIEAGRPYSLALDELGRLYATGENDFGQLGFGDDKFRNNFELVSSLEGKKIVAISAGGDYSLALSHEGKLYATGSNEFGQLGLGDYDRRVAFTLAKSLEGKKIVAIAAGGAHSLALDNEGKLYATGWNDSGQLGFGGANGRNVWRLVSALRDKNIIAIATGELFSLALGDDGKIYAMGDDYDGKLYVMGDNYGAQPKIDDKERRQGFAVLSLEGKKIVAMAAWYGNFAPCFLALTSDGKIYAAGYNRRGQLGLGDNARRAVFTPVPLPNR